MACKELNLWQRKLPPQESGFAYAASDELASGNLHHTPGKYVATDC